MSSSSIFFHSGSGNITIGSATTGSGIFFLDSQASTGHLKIEHNGTTGVAQLSDNTFAKEWATAIGTARSQQPFDLTRPLNTKDAIKDKNLEDVRPPTETTRLHRKLVRVTDLARPSVYVLYQDETVVYVGQSINPYQRMAQHLRDKLFTHIRIMPCRRSRMSYWEEKLIKAYEPSYNVTHNKRKLRLVK